MPSTQSDAVQASVMESNKEMIYLPLETAGEGETNAQSRVLMSLGDARVKVKTEINEARKIVTSSMEEMRTYVENHAELKNPLYIVPRRKGVVSMAANFIYHVDDLIQKLRGLDEELFYRHYYSFHFTLKLTLWRTLKYISG